MDGTKFCNPYLAGVALGLVLLTSFLVMGKGLGASGAANRFGVAVAEVVAPSHVEANPHLRSTRGDRASVLDDWLVFEVFGVIIGGALGAYTAGRFGAKVIRGAGVKVATRLTFAFSGTSLPTTCGASDLMAAACTSLPRPMVKASPWPSGPSSVRSTTYAAL